MTTPPAESHTALRTLDPFGLGRTSAQRSAEILAGLRAVAAPTPENLALSTRAGRIFARIATFLAADRSILAAALARPAVVAALAEQAIGRAPRPAIVVELAAGMGARGIAIARAHPAVDVVEIDLPRVVDDKRARLQRRVQLPSNLRWLAADLAVIPLADLVGEQRAHVVIMEGMLPYFPHPTITTIAAMIREALAPGGVLIADVVHRGGWSGVESDARIASWLTRRQMGRFLGMVADKDEARALFAAAGFADVSVHPLAETAAAIGWPSAVRDTSFVVVAK